MTVYSLELNNQQHAQGFFQVLTNTHKGRVWPAGKPILAGDGNHYVLPNRIVAVDGDVDGELIYKTLGKEELAKTSKSKILAVEQSFKFSRTGGIRFLKHQPQVAKLFYKPGDLSFTEFQGFVNNEYLHSKAARHLGVYPPIFMPANALMVTNKMPGVELFYFLEKVLTEEIHLTANFIFKLTDALLQAFENQILAYKILHKDLKPENILLNTDYGEGLLQASKEELQNYEPQDVETNIVDYAHAREYGKDKFNEGGTEGYIAPEHMQQVFEDEKLDLYPLGIILQMVWGLHRVSRLAKKIESGEKLLMPGTIEYLYSFKFGHQQDSISYATILRMCMLTMNLVTTDPRQRWNFRQLKTAYTNIVNAPHNYIEHEENVEEEVQGTETQGKTVTNELLQPPVYPAGILGTFELVTKLVFDLVKSRVESIMKFMFAYDIELEPRYRVPKDSQVSFTDYSPNLRATLRLEIDKLQSVANGVGFFNYVDVSQVEYCEDGDEVENGLNIGNRGVEVGSLVV